MGFTRWDSNPRPLRPTTVFQALLHLRGFLREHRDPIAKKERCSPASRNRQASRPHRCPPPSLEPPASAQSRATPSVARAPMTEALRSRSTRGLAAT
jgi:hypothetical protein